MSTEIAAQVAPSSFSVSSRRLWLAGLLITAAFYLVAVPAFDVVRLDPIVQSEAIGCTFGDQVRCPVVEAREVLDSFGLLESANGLWEPALVLTHDLPAVVLILIAVCLAAPARLSRAGQRLLFGAIITVAAVMIIPQVVYADTIDAITAITD